MTINPLTGLPFIKDHFADYGMSSEEYSEFLDLHFRTRWAALEALTDRQLIHAMIEADEYWDTCLKHRYVGGYDPKNKEHVHRAERYTLSVALQHALRDEWLMHRGMPRPPDRYTKPSPYALMEAA